jgi:tetratricopeptide (TPR) repeat protein
VRIALNEPKAYQAIMLSSTFTDLKEHRQRATKAIEKFGYRANVMEYDGARADANVIESSLKMVRDSAGYICVISLKYGQTPFDSDENPDRLSITELEFNEAMRLGRPIVLFVMDDEHLIRKTDIESNPSKLKKLDAFRERAKRLGDRSEVERVYEMFETLDEFSTAAAIAVGRLIQHLERKASEPLAGSTPTTKAPARTPTLSNIPINLPLHFLGRDEDLVAIDEALKRNQGRVAITALHGLRGVGKSTLAVAYADQRREDYRATWWIRAETESTMRADLVSLGVRLKWIADKAEEEVSIDTTLAKLGDDGSGVLLIYDNANNSREIQKYLPRGGAARIVVTSTAPDWRGVAAQVEIEVWPEAVGADYLVERSGRAEDRNAALALSKALGGLPLAHEQAAAFCQRIGISLGEYLKRFEATPAKLPGTEQDAPHDYGRTVATTFALAIEAAAKLHPAAEPLIVHAALLAPEPIPLFLFSGAIEELGEPMASGLSGDGLDEAVGALLAFALVDRESIPDERDPTIVTDCIRLHRLVRQVAAARYMGGVREDATRRLTVALARVLPDGIYNDPQAWLRMRRLDPLAAALVGGVALLPKGAERFAAHLLNGLAAYRQAALAAYSSARPLFERALEIREKTVGPNHPDMAESLNNLGGLLRVQGDLAEAQPYYERALEIWEKALGPDHPSTAASLNNLGGLLQAQGDLPGARPYYERALAIREKVLGPDHPDTARTVNNIGTLLQAQNDLASARPYYERALAIREKALGRDHPDMASSLNNIGSLLHAQGDLAGARPYFERALDIFERSLGIAHPLTQAVADNTGVVLDQLKLRKQAVALRKKFSLTK